jgi:hypothetical protein
MNKIIERLISIGLLIVSIILWVLAIYLMLEE